MVQELELALSCSMSHFDISLRANIHNSVAVLLNNGNLWEIFKDPGSISLRLSVSDDLTDRTLDYNYYMKGGNRNTVRECGIKKIYELCNEVLGCNRIEVMEQE